MLAAPPFQLRMVRSSAKLTIAADKRGLEPSAAQSAAHARDDPQRGPGLHRLLAALDLVRSGVLVGNGRLGRAPGDVVDEDSARGGE